MGFLVLIILTGVLIAIVASCCGGNKTYSGGDDFEDYETSAVRGEREYFSDDLARDYNSYYAQLAEVAEMGDEDAMDEIRGEFGDEVW